ncbi:MAG: M48 family metallopeptidase [Cyanobacteria bacterium]|nr:M48 family metallopeptidase [Cyanobacteriota bacterium]MDW8199999.1 SprT family zinc-dependent metalloprotease [Cyanobacteriota bacterium SKYGB_h_bin112]
MTQYLVDSSCMNIPAYQVRESHRAKHVNIRVLATGELQVVIPRGFDRARIPDILHRKQHWITRTLERIHQQRADLHVTQTPPSGITLTAVSETWQVSYLATAATGITAVEKSDHTLVLRGNVAQHGLCREVLRRWLTHKGQQILVPWLREVSHACELPFKQATVRGQKTLWASCSHNKSISLNYKLLFLPPHLVHYVFVHELCHTVHMNHSAQFWALVGSLLGNYRAVDRELRQAMTYVPNWVGKEIDRNPLDQQLCN